MLSSLISCLYRVTVDRGPFLGNYRLVREQEVAGDGLTRNVFKRVPRSDQIPRGDISGVSARKET